MGTYIILYVSYCLIQLAFMYAFKVLVNHRKKIYYRYLNLILVTSFLLTLGSYFHLDSLNSILSIIYYFGLCYFIFRRSIRETIFYEFAVWILGMGFDVLLMFVIKYLISLNLGIDINIYRLSNTIVMEFLLIITVHIKKLRKITNNLFDKMNESRFPYFQCSLIVILLLSLGFVFFSVLKNNTESTGIYFLSISILIFLFLYINKAYSNYSLTESKKYLIKNNEFYMSVVNDYRTLKHNIIHQLSGIKSVSNKESQKLIEDLIKEYNENFQVTQNMNNVPAGISGLLYEKIYSFNNKEIKLGIENSIKSNVFECLTPRSYNLLCEALGVLIDNALQATIKSSEKALMIDLKENEKEYRIKIINTFSDFLDIDSLGTVNYSTKEFGHGIGLFSLIGRKKLKIKTSIINNLFQNEIILEKKSN